MRAPDLLRSGTPFTATDPERARMRNLCALLALVMIPMGIGLYRQSAWATERWPLPDVRMTYIFYASIVASVVGPLAWAAWRNELRALEAIGFEFVIGAPVVGAYLAWLSLDRRDGGLAITTIVFFVFGAMSALLYLWARRVPFRDVRSLPMLLRAVFATFCCLLVPIGGALVFQVKNVLPWELSPENSTVVGLIFLSAAVLFAWIVAHPKWAYGEMSMTAFLAYDLVLFVPYLDLLLNRNDTATVSSYYAIGSTGGETSTGVNEMSLMVYLAVLGVSAVTAIGMYLWGYLVHPAARTALAD